MKRLSLLVTIVALFLASFPVAASTAAQQPVTTSLPGITVAGDGSASAPAERAIVMISVGSDPYMYGGGQAADQPASSPSGPSVPIVTAEDIAAPIVDALVAGGIPATDIEIISNPYAGGYGPYGGPQTVSILFEVANPTVDGIVALLDPAIQAAFGARLYVNYTSVVYSVADCAPLQRESRTAAIADARERASVQAGLLGVTLGDVSASRDNPFGAYGTPYYGVMPVNTCTAGAADPRAISMYGAPAFDPSMPAEVMVHTSVELTFEITPGTGTPAS
jgi:uncharacterized protein YggE